MGKRKNKNHGNRPRGPMTQNGTTHNQPIPASQIPTDSETNLQVRIVPPPIDLNDMSPSLTSTTLVRPTSAGRSPGGFFEQAHEIGIHGGQFQHTMGHHTSVVINLNGKEHEQRVDATTTSSLASSAAPSDVGSIHDQSPLQSEQALSSDSSSTPNERNTAIRIDELGTLSSRSVIPRENGNEIYQRHLQAKRRGFPLWIPEPNMQLPLVYRKKGIDIGDVGIVTPFGGFSFLFNVCLPADNPVNPSVLPEGFEPMSQPVARLEYREFKPNSYLASSSIEESRNDTSIGLSFQTSASEGAILTMPHGAITHDLENIAKMRAYATKNIASWYRYANGPRGLEVNNGDIRLVIGCDKASSWGMAALSNLNQRGAVSHLKFKPLIQEMPLTVTSSFMLTVPSYTWEHSGMAEARVGPDPEDVEELWQAFSEEGPHKYHNQCLFMRTLNLMLGDNEWAALNHDLDLAAETGDDSYPTHMGHKGTDKSTYPHQGSNKDISDSQKGSVHVSSQSTLGRNLTTSSLYPDSRRYHPSTELNAALLNLHPNAVMVATCDQDWYSIAQEDPGATKDNTQIVEKILLSHCIREEKGIIFLEPKNMLDELVKNYMKLQRNFSEIDKEQSLLLWSKDPDNESGNNTPLFQMLDSIESVPDLHWSESASTSGQTSVNTSPDTRIEPFMPLSQEINHGTVKNLSTDVHDFTGLGVLGLSDDE